MLSLKFTVIFYQLIEGDGMVAVQIHTGIQHMVPALNQRPEIRRGICCLLYTSDAADEL